MLENYFVDSCELIQTSTNDFGDQIEGVTQTLPCRWRDITLVRRGNHMDNSDASSLVHLPPTAPVHRGAVLKYRGEYYQVETINFARRLGETDIQFIKCEVNVYSLGIS
jgi:hypothetical protein